MNYKQRDVGFLVYEPISWEKQLGYKVDMTRCRASVHQQFGVGFYQCLKKPKRRVGGYSFCEQHAKIAEEKH